MAFPTHVHVNLTIVSIFARILLVFCYGSPEESLAALAGERIIMVSTGSIATDQTQLLLLPYVGHTDDASMCGYNSGLVTIIGVVCADINSCNLLLFQSSQWLMIIVASSAIY